MEKVIFDLVSSSSSVWLVVVVVELAYAPSKKKKYFFSRNEMVFVKILAMHYDYASHARVYTEIV